MSLLAAPLLAASLLLGSPIPAAVPEPPVPSTALAAPTTQPDKEEEKPKTPKVCEGKAAALSICKQPGKRDEGSYFSVGGWMKKALNSFADSFAAGSIQMLGWMATWWVEVPSPQLGDAPGSPIGFLRTSTLWLTGFTTVLGLLAAAGRMAWERRGEPLREALAGLVRLVVVSGCSVAVVNLALSAGDSYSTAVWNAGAAGTDVSGAAKWLLGGANVAVLSNPTVTIILGVLVILSGLVQFAMMMLRAVMVVVLAGLLPLAASASITSEGRPWLRKMSGWLLAYLLYKPTAATLYGVAMLWMRTGDGLEPIQGLVLMIVAVAALPALLHFTAPQTGPATGDGDAPTAAVAAMAAMGAKALPSLGGNRSGPSGAQPTPAPPGNDETSGEVAGDDSGSEETDIAAEQPVESSADSSTSSGGPDGADKPGKSDTADPDGHVAQDVGASGAAPHMVAADLIAEGARFGKQATYETTRHTTDETDVASGAR